MPERGNPSPASRCNEHPSLGERRLLCAAAAALVRLFLLLGLLLGIGRISRTSRAGLLRLLLIHSLFLSATCTGFAAASAALPGAPGAGGGAASAAGAQGAAAPYRQAGARNEPCQPHSCQKPLEFLLIHSCLTSLSRRILMILPLPKRTTVASG